MAQVHIPIFFIVGEFMPGKQPSLACSISIIETTTFSHIRFKWLHFSGVSFNFVFSIVSLEGADQKVELLKPDENLVAVVSL